MKIKIYSYDGQAKEVELPIDNRNEIEEIDVVVVTGDETGTILLRDGTKIEFDASDCRRFDWFDTQYTVREKDIGPWLDFVPSIDVPAAYDRANMIDDIQNINGKYINILKRKETEK